MKQKISEDQRKHQVTKKQPTNRENAPRPGTAVSVAWALCSLMTQMSSELFFKCTDFFTHEVISQSTRKHWTYTEFANKYF